MRFEELLIMHASPTLANLKPASLISMRDSEHEKECLENLEKRGLMFFPLINNKGQNLLLVYRNDKLKRALSNPLASKIMEHLGYPEGLEEKLGFLRKRFQATSCPHEVGLFLGYPAEDVEGFIRDGGKNPMLSGLWKVYSSADRAIKLFSMYGRCRDIYRTMYRNGTSIARLCVSA